MGGEDGTHMPALFIVIMIIICVWFTCVVVVEALCAFWCRGCVVVCASRVKIPL